MSIAVGMIIIIFVAVGAGNTGGEPLPFVPRLSLVAGLILVILLIMQALLVAMTARFLHRSILMPLDAIGKASRQIEQGNLSFMLPSSPTMEMAEVITAFNAMGKALREALARQEKLEEERRFFISAVVHDLRTPLFSLRGYLEGIEAGIADTPEMVAHYMRTCREKADDLEYLITDLFTYTQLEYLELQPQREHVDMDELLQKIVEDMRPIAENSELTLTARCEGSPEGVDTMVVDRRLIRRALENLLDNAVRYTPRYGSIAFNWVWSEERLLLTVADTGPGIAPQDLPHVFKPLHRGEASRNRQTGGAGLGLSIAQQIFQAHGGELSVTNQASGGAMFLGTLPLQIDNTGESNILKDGIKIADTPIVTAGAL
jgi:signal transduction histidine kinase